MATLVLEPVGCPLREDDSARTDLNNYRYFADVIFADGAKVKLEVSKSMIYRKSAKGDVKRVSEWGLGINTYHYRDNGDCIRYKTTQINSYIDKENLAYCIADLLKLVNAFSETEYNNISYEK